MMVEFINEPVVVEVHLRDDGTASPQRFVWRSHRYRIRSWGREGTEARDGRAQRCYLVQTSGPVTWELCQDTETAQWLLIRRWAARRHAV